MGVGVGAGVGVGVGRQWLQAPDSRASEASDNRPVSVIFLKIKPIKVGGEPMGKRLSKAKYRGRKLV